MDQDSDLPNQRTHSLRKHTQNPHLQRISIYKRVTFESRNRHWFTCRQLLPRTAASAYSEHAWPSCQSGSSGWLIKMAPLMPRLRLHFSAAIVVTLLNLLSTSAAHAQLQGDSPPPSQLSSSQSSGAQPAKSTDPPTGKLHTSKDFTLKGDSFWTDTGVDVQPGEHIVATAQGTLRYVDAKEDNGPDGLPRGFKDVLRILPFNGAGRGALLARIGDADVAQPFVLGASHDVISPVAGRLSLGINQSKNDTGDGSYTVHLDIYASNANAGATLAIANTVTALPGIDNSLFAKIPRRIRDKDGNP